MVCRSAAWGSTYINDFVDRGRVKRVYMQADAPYRALPTDLDNWQVRSSTTGDIFLRGGLSPSQHMMQLMLQKLLNCTCAS